MKQRTVHPYTKVRDAEGVIQITMVVLNSIRRSYAERMNGALASTNAETKSTSPGRS